MDNNKPGMSVIVPFFNEEKAIPIFCNTLDEYVKGLPFAVEFVFVNDGSTDCSLEILKNYLFKNISDIKIISLSKNFGFHPAVRAGISQARFEYCTWFGVDLQEPLEILPISFTKLHDEKCEAVYFEKKTIKISRANRMFSKIYSYLMQKYAVKTYSTDGTATIAFGPQIKKLLNENIESNSSLMLQILDFGFKYDRISLNYLERSIGNSKWSLSKKMKLFIDSFVAFSFMPIRLVSIIGILIFIIGFLIGLFTIVNRIINPYVPSGYSTLASIMALGFGITNISLGIIAEYLWRTYDAARKRPVFIIDSIFDVRESREIEHDR